MSRLLYIESSPRKERSKSIKVARAFLEEYKQRHQDDEVITLDVAKTESAAIEQARLVAASF